jgi:poly(A) polymerase
MQALPDLKHAPWLNDAPSQRVMNALEAAGGAARFVGGCVRNALLGREVADIDIATTLVPDDVVKALSMAGVKAVPTGIEHGTITAVADGKPFEVTTLRRDLETDGRRAVVAFSQDWNEDAQRRDFTMNALYAERNGAVFDPIGQGWDDLVAGRVRFIGDAVARIREDYLRILRLFRIHAWYGQGELDKVSLRAAAAEAKGLDGLSGERIQKELLRLLAADDPVTVLRAMTASGIAAHVLPGVLQIERLQKIVAIDSSASFAPDAILRLGALLTAEEQARQINQRWRMSNADSARLSALTKSDGPRIVSYLSIREVRRLLYRIGKERFRDLARLRWAEDAKATNAVQWRALIAMGDAFERPVMAITGREVVAAGVPNGPLVGRVLSELEEWWIDTDFTDDGFSLLERLKAIVQALAF